MVLYTCNPIIQETGAGRRIKGSRLTFTTFQDSEILS